LAPWALLVVIVFCWGYFRPKIDAIPGAVINWPVPRVHEVVYRTPPVVPKQTIDKAIYSIQWLSASGTSICFAAILAGLIAGLSPAQWKLAAVRTATRLRLPLLTICLILSMGFLTKYSGMDAVLGLAFTKTGRFYPFFAAMLGWLGVALTGSDTSSNIMFGSMQQIAARQGGFSEVLITASNSTGGVMGKMIDAQSIVVATAACYEDPKAGKLAAGPIFRKVLPHSIALAVLMGVLVMLQAYWWTWMVPEAVGR
jgi:lactate permease